MTLTAGALSKVSVGSTTASLLSAVATSGTSPYTYQWYRSTTSGFTVGAGYLVSGATSLTLNDTGLTPGTQYYYKVRATDAVSATADATQLSVLTAAPSLAMDQLALQPFLGMTDLRFNSNVIEVQFDPAGSGTIVGGQACVFTTTAGGAPKVVPSTAQSDIIAGYALYDIKSQSHVPGDKLELALSGTVVYLYATAAVNRGVQVVSLPYGTVGGCNGGVYSATGSTGYPIVGWALDTAAVSGTLIRVMMMTPAFINDATGV